MIKKLCLIPAILFGAVIGNSCISAAGVSSSAVSSGKSAVSSAVDKVSGNSAAAAAKNIVSGSGSITDMAVNMISGVSGGATASIGGGATVAGCCGEDCAWSTGVIATPSGVSGAFTWVDKTLTEGIENIGKRYKGGYKKLSKSLDKGFEIQTSTLRHILKKWSLAGEQMQNYREVGITGSADQNRTGRLIGYSAAAVFDAGLRQKIELYARSFDKKRDIAGWLERIEKINPQYVFPADTTLTAGRSGELYTNIKTVVDAFPATNLPDDIQGKNMGAIYRKIRKIKEFRNQMAEAVLSEIMSGYAPIIPAGAKIQKMYKKAGGSGTPPQMEDGRFSLVSYLGFLVKSRFANKNYRTGKQGIHSMIRAEIIRELANVQALQLALERRQLRRSQQIAFLAAERVAGRTAAKSLGLRALYNKVLQSSP